MKLEDIKKLSKRRAKAKNPQASNNRNVYGGVGVYNHGSATTTPTPPTDGGGDGDGGDGGGGE